MKKRLWSPEEDEKLKAFVNQHGTSKWRDAPLQTGLERSAKSCRLRWVNQLRPGIRRGDLSLQEKDLVFQFQSVYGNRWSLIAQLLPGRTDNDIKNFWRQSAKRSAKVYEKSLPLEQTTNYRLAVPFNVGFDEPNMEGQIHIDSIVMPWQNTTAEEPSNGWSLPIHIEPSVIMPKHNISTPQSSTGCSLSNMENTAQYDDFICESLWDVAMHFELLENPPTTF